MSLHEDGKVSFYYGKSLLLGVPDVIWGGSAAAKSFPVGY